MSDAGQFLSFEQGLRRLDENAVHELLIRFTKRLVRLARGQMAIRLQTKEDPQDVVQSVMRSFCLRYADGQFAVGSWDSLWALLAKITTNKCLTRSERYRTLKRDARREQSIDDPALVESAIEMWSREPQPDEAVLLAETVEGLIKSLESERERAILELALQGYSADEIGPRVGRTGRSVQRVLTRVRERLTASLNC
jgi:RNA polymerase sigma factor (sigma-70 family)